MKSGITTQLLHADRQQGVEHGAVHKPMHAAAAYQYNDVNDLCGVFQGTQAGFSYARQGTPTTAALEHKITLLEQGIGTVSFATGMAALTGVFSTLLRAGDHVVSSQYIFGNTNSLFATLQLLGVEVTLVDPTRLEAVADAIRPHTRLVFVETIANPGVQVANLRGIGTLCEERGLLFVVDNTISTPYLFQPRSVGAGLVVNSLTKYIGGHGNAMGGAVTDVGGFDWAKYPNILDIYQQGDSRRWGLTQIRKKGLRDQGATLASEPAHRIAVGAETLALRMERACTNALTLAQWLTQQPEVAKVNYPGLPEHPQHAWARQWFHAAQPDAQPRFGALLSFELQEGLDCLQFLNFLKVVILSTHLGDTRTLALPAAHTIYYEMGAARRAQMGIADSLIRISVGIEEPDDLLADFDQALQAISQEAKP